MRGPLCADRADRPTQIVPFCVLVSQFKLSFQLEFAENGKCGAQGLYVRTVSRWSPPVLGVRPAPMPWARNAAWSRVTSEAAPRPS